MPMGMFRSLGEDLHLLRLAGCRVEVGEDEELVGRLSRCRGERVVVRSRDPEPALGVEGHLHRLLDVRLARDELHLEARRQRELLPLFRGRHRAGGSHEVRRQVRQLGLRENAGRAAASTNANERGDRMNVSTEIDRAPHAGVEAGKRLVSS